MSLRTILTNLRDILAQNQEIQDFCNDKYSKLQTVYLGRNWEKPPTPEKWPAILIAYIPHHEKKHSRNRVTVVIGYYIGNENETETANTVTFDGFLEAEELREKTEEVIYNNQAKLGKVEFEANTLETPLFPLFTSISTITFENVISSRR